MQKVKGRMSPYKALSTTPSCYYLKLSPTLDLLLSSRTNIKAFPFLHYLLHHYIYFLMLQSNQMLPFNSFIPLLSESSTLCIFSRSSRSKYLASLVTGGFIVKAESRGTITYYITEHYMALYIFFISQPQKVLEQNFNVLKGKVGEIMRKRPNYEDTEAILKACVNLASNVEVADNSAGKESAVDKKGKKILRKPKSKELKEATWLRHVKASFKEKALIHGLTDAGDNLKATNKELVQKHMPDDSKTFKEKADFAADAFMQYLLSVGKKVAGINQFASNFASWMHDGFKAKATGGIGGKNAPMTQAKQDDILARNKKFLGIE